MNNKLIIGIILILSSVFLLGFSMILRSQRLQDEKSVVHPTIQPAANNDEIGKMNGAPIYTFYDKENQVRCYSHNYRLSCIKV